MEKRRLLVNFPLVHFIHKKLKLIADMEYTTENMKACRKTLINKCEQHLNLEGVKMQDQDRVSDHCPKILRMQILKKMCNKLGLSWAKLSCQLGFG